MQIQKDIILTERSTVSLAVAAVSLGILAIAMETVFDVPLKLPGHRAFPGALCLLLFAEAFTPLLCLGLAAMVSATLVIAGQNGPSVVIVWIVAAIAILALKRLSTVRPILYFLICGLLFGIIRYLSQTKGFHHTPEIARIGGHLSFGALGGLSAFAISHFTGRKGKF